MSPFLGSVLAWSSAVNGCKQLSIYVNACSAMTFQHQFYCGPSGGNPKTLQMTLGMIIQNSIARLLALASRRAEASGVQ